MGENDTIWRVDIEWLGFGVVKATSGRISNY